MPLSVGVRERARAFLKPGEEIRYLFPATWVNASSLNPPFIFVVTDVSVTVLSTGVVSRSRPKAVWGRYPRNTRIGPVDIVAGRVFTVGRSTFEVDGEYVAVINAADAEISPEPLPENRLPGR